MSLNSVSDSAGTSGHEESSQEPHTVAEVCAATEAYSCVATDEKTSTESIRTCVTMLVEASSSSPGKVADGNGDGVMSSLSPDRSVKRPRLPDPVTSSLSPHHAPPLKQMRTDQHSSATAQASPSAGGVPSRTAAPQSQTAAPAAPARAVPAKVPIKMPVKTPVSRPSAISLRTSPLLTTPPASSLASHSVHSTPSTTPRTTPTTPGRTPLHQRWITMLEKVFAMDCQPHEMERVMDVSARIVACIPGSKEVAADTFLMLKANLADEKNEALRRRVLSGELPVELLVTLNEKDLVNPERRKELDAGFEERSRDRNITEMMKAVQTTSKLFPCPACKVRDCTWLQKQTRSGDEPMTVFCTCNRCGYKWKRF